MKLQNAMIAMIIVAVMAVLIIATNIIFKRILKKANKIQFRLLKALVVFAILAVGIYIVLSLFEFTRNISKTLVTSSALLLAVATFAAQQTLGNVIGGIAIAVSKPLNIGHKVRILQGGSLVAEGIVKDITLRHIVIEQVDGQSCIVPNAIVDSSVIMNINYFEDIGNFIEFEVGYGSDIDHVKDVIMEVLAQEPLLLRYSREKILVSRLTSNGMIVKFAVWTKTVDENFVACSNLRQHIVEAFRKEGIEIPYQTITITPAE